MELLKKKKKRSSFDKNCAHVFCVKNILLLKLNLILFIL